MAERITAPRQSRSLAGLPRNLGNSWVSLRNNPILIKELRQRMRSWHGLLDLCIYTVLLGVFGLLIYAFNTFSVQPTYRSYGGYGYYGGNYGGYSYGAPYLINQRSQEIGTDYFVTVVIGQLFLICLLACNFSAASVATEKERQTYDLLMITLLRPRDIVAGKLTASLAYLLLVTVAGLPIPSVAFLLGGIGGDQLVAALITILLSCLMLSALGVFWSCRSRNVKQAARRSFYSILLGLFILPGAILYVKAGSLFSLLTRVPYLVNTFWDEVVSWILSANPLYALVATNETLKRSGNLFFYTGRTGSWEATPFLRFVLISVALTAFFVWLAVRQVKPGPFETEKQQAVRSIRQRLARKR